MASRSDEPSSKLVVTRRSVSSLATSTSWVIVYESRRIGWPSPTRGDSASSRPFSAIRQWPPKTTSVVDSDGPLPAIAYAAIERPDWPTTRSVRYRLLPIVSLLAERLSRIVAPAIACKAAGRYGHPEVLADLDAHEQRCRFQVGLLRPSASNRRSIPNGTRWPPSSISAGRLRRGRAEPAALVEFLVIGDVLLGDDAPDRAIADHDSAVEQAVAGGDRRPDDDELLAARGRPGDPQDGPNPGVQQRRLAEQVGAGVAGDAQLREEHDVAVGHLLEDADDLGGVGRRVGHRRPGRGAGDADKPILVHGISSTSSGIS